MPDIRVEGTEKLHAVYKELKRVGDVDLKKRLTRAIRDSTKPMKEAVKASALERLPKRGGLATLIANSRVTNKIKTGSRTAGVNIKATNLHQIVAMNKGRLRHKVYGGPWAKETQSVSPGWFSDPINEKVPEIQRAVMRACEDVARELSDNGSKGPAIGI